MQVKGKYRILSVLLCIAVFMSLSFTLVFAESSEGTAEKKTVTSASSERKDAAEKSISGDEAVGSASETLAEQDELKVISKDSFFIDGEPGYEDDYIDWNGSEDFILNKGENMHLDFSMHDTWEGYSTIPAFDIWSLENDETVFTYNPAGSDLVVSADDWDHYTGVIDIGSVDLEPGYYFIAIQAMPCDPEGAWVEDLSGFEIPEEYVDFVIKDTP